MNTREKTDKPAAKEIARLVEQARTLGDMDQYTGKRASLRFKVALPLEATKDPDNPAGSWTLSMHNISHGGFSAWSKTRMQPRETFYVREYSPETNCPWLEVVVRHCTYGIRGYLIGAEFLHSEPRAEAVGQRPRRAENRH
jgi:hypothetical protein